MGINQTENVKADTTTPTEQDSNANNSNSSTDLGIRNNKLNANDGGDKNDSSHSQAVASKTNTATKATETAKTSSAERNQANNSENESAVKKTKATNKVNKKTRSSKAKTRSRKVRLTGRKVAVKKLRSEISQLSPADQAKLLGASFREEAPSTRTLRGTATETVSDWQGLVNALNNQNDGTIILGGDITVTKFRIATFDTHKTNDGSANAMATVNAPKLDKMVFTNQAYNTDTHQYKDVSSVTYTLNSDGTKYVATSLTIDGQTYTDANSISSKLHSVNSNAVMEFDVSQVQTSWMPSTDSWSQGKDRRANTDASNFTPGSGTGTSLAQSQYTNPDGDQRSKSPEALAGNSRARANINLTGTTAASIFGNNIGWINVFGNFYGATTASPLTFKQNSDISHLTQEQFRQLIDVTDLGANGWNGTNINPNAPQVLAYEPGTDTSKKFAMIWAPNGQPSTATVANGVRGTVRILFNDGTYLDVPATINVEADSNADKPDSDKTSFNQKISYQYNGQEVSSYVIPDIAKGSSLSADKLAGYINNNLPANYNCRWLYIPRRWN